MIVAIHQPNYLPWMGYFYKIHESDIFVFLDDVQFSNQGMHNYSYIKTPQGEFRLKIPVEQNLGDKILNVKFRENLSWKEKHLKTIESNYKKAPYFFEVMEDFESLLSNSSDSLSIFNIDSIKFFARKLGLDKKFCLSSELRIEGNKTDKIYNICKTLGADTYLSGNGAKVYQKEVDFNANGLNLIYTKFKPFAYSQLWNDFQSNVFCLDYFMNCGYDFDNLIKHQVHGE